MRRRFRSKTAIILIAITVLVSGFSTNIFAAGGNVINEGDILADGSPLCIWHLDEGTGTTIKDSGGNNVNGTLYFNSSVQASYFWTLGRERSGIRSIPASNSFVAIQSNSRLLFKKTDSFTISAWIKINDSQNKWVGVITQGRHTDEWYGIWISSNNRWVFGGQGQNIFGPTVTPGWHHVVIVQNGSTNKRYIYVDGSLAGTGYALDATNGGPLLFGKAGGVEGEHFQGVIDEVCLYNYALSSAHINDIWKKMENTLNVPVYGQSPYGDLCWATCSSMLVSYFLQDYKDRKVEIAKEKHGSIDFNKPASITDSMNAVEKRAPVNGKVVDDSLSYLYIQGEIHNNTPILASISYKDGLGGFKDKGHEIVIRGYFLNNGEFSPTDLKKYIRINNPGGNGFSQLLYYDYFCDNANYKWTRTVTFDN